MPRSRRSGETAKVHCRHDVELTLAECGRRFRKTKLLGSNDDDVIQGEASIRYSRGGDPEIYSYAMMEG